ncbi:MAG: OsmC family protein [Planctomycetota bacterium]
MKTNTSTRINGIDVDALQGAIAAIRENPAAGQSRWAIRSEWVGGTRTDHHVEGSEIGGQATNRRFTLRVDEPLELCGSDEYPNPQEYLLSALNGCMMVGYAAVAALMGIQLDRLEVEVSGNIDLRGFLGIDEEVACGYESLQQTVRVSADVPNEQLEQLHAAVLRTSPNFFNVTRAIPTRSELVIE